MTGKQRLKVLANYLLSGAVNDYEFNMHEWPRCAIGEGSRIPSLQKEGLHLTCESYPEPEYRGKRGVSACALFFRIPYNAADRFFGSELTATTAVAVGRQLLDYLRRH